MKKKFFSLIHGEDIEIAPGTKVVPANEFSKVLDGRQVLTRVQKDALLYKKEIATECEKIKEVAYQEGYEAGFLAWSEHIKHFDDQILSIRKEFTNMIAPVALKATQKIVGKAFEISPEVIYSIVENALKPVLQHKKITIYVNKNDLASLEQNRSKLKALFESIEVLSIQEREDVTQGGCVIETEGGIINARLENQWDILAKAFEKLSKSLS